MNHIHISELPKDAKFQDFVLEIMSMTVFEKLIIWMEYASEIKKMHYEISISWDGSPNSRLQSNEQLDTFTDGIFKYSYPYKNIKIVPFHTFVDSKMYFTKDESSDLYLLYTGYNDICSYYKKERNRLKSLYVFNFMRNNEDFNLQT